jgi:hypothetical protein
MRRRRRSGKKKAGYSVQRRKGALAEERGALFRGELFPPEEAMLEYHGEEA